MATEDGHFEIEEHDDHLYLRARGRFTEASAHSATAEAARVIRQEGKRWNIVTDFSNASVEERGANKVIADYSKGNRPYVRKSAVLGLKGVKRFFFDVVVRVSGRYDLRPFRTYEEALRWFAEPLPEERGQE